MQNHRRILDARVLVVDDVWVNLEIAKGILGSYGITVDCVASGQEAVDLIREEKVHYNVVFMDHIMPLMDGIEAVRLIRTEIKTGYAKTLPIIALTADGVMDTEELFLQNGFQGFLSKPIHPGRLDEVINRWIRDKTLDQGQCQPSQEPLPWDTPGIPGIDRVKARSAFNGNWEIFTEILKSYRTHTPQLLETLENPQRETLGEYAVAVHGLKGSSYSIGADPAGNQAAALEKAAKAGNLEFVQTHTVPFIRDIEVLMGDIDRLLQGLSQGEQKIKKTAPDPALLRAFGEACRQYDIASMDTLMEELEQFHYETQEALITWLREQMTTSRFDQIAERLSREGGF